jgi:tripeptidyl-peptidase I
VEKYVTPSTDTVKVVNEWLGSHGITAKTLTPAGDWLSFSVPVEKASAMFDADFHLYKHSESGREVIRTTSYSIPAHIKGHVELLYPGISCVFLLLFVCIVPMDRHNTQLPERHQ